MGPHPAQYASASEIAATLAAAIESQYPQFTRTVDLSEDLTKFMIFDPVDLLAVAEQLLARFQVFPVPSYLTIPTPPGED